MPTPTLSTLPYDILRIITSHLPTASSFTSFSTTCKSLHSFITTEGWRVFLQTRFPSFHAEVIRESQSRHRAVQPTDWLTWVQEQTLVRRNWERRGFIARVLEPEVGIYVPTGPRAGMWGRRVEPPKRWQWVPGGSRGKQTMKYLPVLDAYESVWGSGEEVLAIGAGPDLALRKCKSGDEERWWGFEDRAERAGRDDVTALQLLRYGEKGGYGKGEVAVVGRANGKLEMVGLRTDGDAARIGKSDVLERYETGGLTVKSASLLHREGNGMMSAVLSNSNIALYPISTPESSTPQIPTVNPISELILTEGEIPWKTTFLSPSLLALGTTSSDPLTIFTISPDDGIRKTPLRTFSATECTGTKTMSVYATASLPTSTGTPENAGETFLGGWYDGVSRLHDLRSPAQFVATYTDPIDAQTPIYSLAPLGRQRFIVGGGRHCILKIFDLRMSGVYDYAHSSSPGWATYLSPPARYRPHSNSADWESPIYSLAVGASGKAVYAGAQGRVWGMDFVGTERRIVRPLSPLPLVQPSVSVREAAVSAAKDVGTRLTMYEFGWTGTMYRQGPESEMGSAGLYDGRIDGRWRATLSCEE